METKKIGKLTCNFVNAKSSSICYILAPIALDNKQITRWATYYRYNIVVINGMDWDNDLTPWTAPGISPEDPDFKGLASGFLSFLREELMPEMEHTLGMVSPINRTLAGISLSGLFALWAWINCDDFTNIGSISGSFWYDRFTDWFIKTDKHPQKGYAYLSLGDMEAKNINPRYRTVENCTVHITEALCKAGIKMMFEVTSGTHFAPLYPRLDKMFQGLSELSKHTY